MSRPCSSRSSCTSSKVRGSRRTTKPSIPLSSRRPVARSRIARDRSGSADGVRLDSPVVSGPGLVGIVSNVFPHSAKVTLLSDPDSFVAAFDLSDPGPRNGAYRAERDADPRPGSEDGQGEEERRARHRRDAHRRYPDLYPYGIPIGRVTSVGAADTAVYLQVQVQPFANLGSLDSVAVLVPRKPHR